LDVKLFHHVNCYSVIIILFFKNLIIKGLFDILKNKQEIHYLYIANLSALKIIETDAFELGYEGIIKQV
jgi:hypothetical protein